MRIVKLDGVETKVRTEAKGYRHHETISSLTKAAEAGCDLCCLLLEETRNSRMGFASALDLTTSRIYARFRDYYSDSITSKIVFYQSDPKVSPDLQALSTLLSIYVDPDDPASRLGYIRGQPVTPELSTYSFVRAKKWIEDCISLHPRCRNPPDFFPPRVIDVGACDGSEEPRLIIDETKRAPWVALSHCWGGGISSATLRSNLDTRSEVLPVSILPINFRDAITITRELGYRYLWIDALCILQDSESDWQGHLPHMGNIYQFAVVTIVADVASDSDTGILLKRKQADISVPVPYRSLSREVEGAVYFRPLLYEYPKGPVQRRGWTLQEDLLSVRSLYFSEDQLLWQCQTNRMNEGEMDSPDTHSCDSFGTETFLKRSFLLPNGQSTINMTGNHALTRFYPTSPSEEALDHWYSILNEYARRNLTVEQDRLPALSGIARQIEKRTGYQYKAGLWLEDLHVGLLWSSNGTGRKRENIDCPSWTWAGVVFAGPGLPHEGARVPNPPYDVSSGPRSVTRGIFPTVIHERGLVKDIQLETSEDVYGVIKSGKIIMEGKTQSAPDWRARHSLPLLYKRGERFDLSDLIQMRMYAEPITDSPHILCELDYHEDWPNNWTAENQAQFETGVTFLQIYRLSGCKDNEAQSEHYHRGYEKLSIAYALILESTGKEGEYRRRGIAEIPCENGMADNGWDIQTVNVV